jgi:hypothetical protein
MVMTPRKILDAKADVKGNITHVKLQGNSNFTPIATAVGMADKGAIAGAHAVHPVGGKPHLRSNPNGRKADNLDTMAGDD